MSTRANVLAIAVMAGSLLSSGALAVEGMTTGDAPMRVGPGEGFAEIGSVKAGSALKIHSCNDGQTWCLVRIGGRSGWITGEVVRAGGYSKAKSYFDPAASVSLEFQVFDDEAADVPVFSGPGYPVAPYSLAHRRFMSDKRLPRDFRSTIDSPGFRLHKQGFPEIIGD